MRARTDAGGVAERDSRVSEECRLRDETEGGMSISPGGGATGLLLQEVGVHIVIIFINH